MEDRQEIFAKSVALRLLDDEPVGRSFIEDIEIDYIAPEITYLFQNLSYAFFDMVVAAAGAFLFYKAYQQTKEKQSREELISRIESALKEHEKEIHQCFKNLENRIDKFDTKYERITREMIEERKRDGKSEVVARREVEHEIISERKRRLSALSEKAKKFKPSKKNAESLAEIMENEYKQGHSAQKSHVDQFR
jgi:hydroxymethylpyrimidine pyrophosphatase-like HAD family hydrolase